MTYVYLTPKGNKANLVPVRHIVRAQPHRRGSGLLVWLTGHPQPLEVEENLAVIEEAMKEAGE